MGRSEFGRAAKVLLPFGATLIQGAVDGACMLDACMLDKRWRGVFR
jgi:hypothetical protein